MNGYTIYWYLWLFVGFLAPELYAMFTNPYNTLSENYWRLEDLNTAQPFDFKMWTDTHWAAALFVWLLFGWLSLHLPFGLLR